MAEQHFTISLEDLDLNILSNIIKWLTPEEVAIASLACRLLRNAADAGVVWQHLYDTALCPRVKERLLPRRNEITDWRAAVLRGLFLGRLRYGAWERLGGLGRECGLVRPCPREGHAAASWGTDSMILFGGWGCGIRNDLFILDRVYDTQVVEATQGSAGPPPTAPLGCPVSAAAAAAAAAAGPGPSRPAPLGRPGSEPAAEAASGLPSADSSAGGPGVAAAEGDGGGGASWLGTEERPCGRRWRVPRVAGRRPAVRYGHTVTRCGPNGDMLAVYGGMQAGGYTAEINSLAILRPYTPEGGEGAAGLSAPDPSTSNPNEPEYEYEWLHPQLSGPDPGARGYHAACASEDGRRLFVFGGIARRGSIARLAVIDLTTWSVDLPATTGTPPSPRFGCSLVAYGNRLWVIGGGYGCDLARSGHDLADCFTLDLASLEWSRLETTNRPHNERVLGRCHASTLVGSRLVLFGGSLELGNDVAWLDLDSRTWSHPRVLLGQPPSKRMSAVMALSGSDLLVFGGWIYSSGEMGDLHRLRLLLDEKELARARRVAHAASVAGRRGARGSGGACGAVAPDASEQLVELLSSKMARYYTLMREAQRREDGGGEVPQALVREMHEVMIAIRLLRARAEQDDLGFEMFQDGGDDDDGDEEEDGSGFVWGAEEEGDDDDDDDEEEEEEEGDEEEGDEDGEGGEGLRRGGGLPALVVVEEEDGAEGARSHDSEETGEEETEEDTEEDVGKA